MKKLLSLLFISLYIVAIQAQIIPQNRITDWSGAGAKTVFCDTLVNILDYGADPQGNSNTSSALSAAINSLPFGGTVFFPSGTYLFSNSQNIPSGIKIKGEAASSTVFNFDNNGIGNLFSIFGTVGILRDTLVNGYSKDSKTLIVEQSSSYQAGDYIKLVEDDNGRIYSSFAFNTIGQIVRIDSVDYANNQLFIDQFLRQNYTSTLFPRIQLINPRQNIGFECFTINRLDVTTGQTANFNFVYSVNCYIKGVESFFSNFSHVKIENSSNITVRESFFKDGHDYGSGGKAYGIALQSTSGNCLVENNQFEHLRHSVLLQSSANGNVIAYNYSKDPYWTGVMLPSNSAGDLVLHGNYPYMNLFEGNICQNVVIDNSHGINGPYNTFFRNRAQLYGFFMNTSPASNSQNFVANEITSSSLGMYLLQGTDHFEYGNNHNGVIKPTGTDTLTHKSYYKNEIPLFWNHNFLWPNIGISNFFNRNTIPAFDNYSSNQHSLCSGNNDTVFYFFEICPSQDFIFNQKLYNQIGVFADSLIDFNNEKKHLQIEISHIPKPIIITQADHLSCLSNGVGFQWFLDGNILTGEINNTLYYTQSGHYHIAVMDSNFCYQTSDSIQITTVSNDYFEEHLVSISPNPTSGIVHFTSSSNQNQVRLTVYTIFGQKLWFDEHFILPNSLQLENYPNGVYIITISDINTQSSFRIIKMSPN